MGSGGGQSANRSQRIYLSSDRMPYAGMWTRRRTGRIPVSCTRMQTSVVRDFTQAALGRRYTKFWVRNSAAEPCTVTGYPRVVARGVHGERIYSQATNAEFAPVVIPPHGRAEFTIDYEQPSFLPAQQCHPVAAANLTISLPGQRGGHSVRFRQPICTRPRHFINVGPIQIAVPQKTQPANPPGGTGGSSHPQLWSALEGKVTCGIGIHVASPARTLVCNAGSIPAPTGVDSSLGEPGWVGLEATGRPVLFLNSQVEWQVSLNETKVRIPGLAAGTTWRFGPLGIACAISAESVTCTNQAGHGFTVTAESYSAF
jgi:Protein of unknown function (DUF4232)